MRNRVASILVPAGAILILSIAGVYGAPGDRPAESANPVTKNPGTLNTNDQIAQLTHQVRDLSDQVSRLSDIIARQQQARLGPGGGAGRGGPGFAGPGRRPGPQNNQRGFGPNGMRGGMRPGMGQGMMGRGMMRPGMMQQLMRQVRMRMMMRRFMMNHLDNGRFNGRGGPMFNGRGGGPGMDQMRGGPRQFGQFNRGFNGPGSGPGPGGGPGPGNRFGGGRRGGRGPASRPMDNGPDDQGGGR